MGSSPAFGKTRLRQTKISRIARTMKAYFEGIKRELFMMGGGAAYYEGG